ncbi:hypothetical protein QTI66_22450 [Variovorax sp. J22R133]|uniref:hypothetical protein n=1 Tax=Variovorax brevis TaxID=3053503 RepID=UPI0025781114|nr:hypothetical protein [Variovorax sp. J22R133]MDM0114927.1 hypothetical protein [Variovorax sp. J22R133]
MSGVHPSPANDESDELRDPALRKALENAPDDNALPDWRLRQAILQQAHDAVAASEELLVADRQGSSWWSLDFWLRKLTSRSAMPWNAGFATVLVAVLATLMWHREPVPDARLEEKASESVRAEMAGKVASEPSRDSVPSGQVAPAAPPATAGAPVSASPQLNRQAAAPAPAVPAVPPEPPPTPVAEPRVASAPVPAAPSAAAVSPPAPPSAASPSAPKGATSTPPVAPSVAPFAAPSVAPPGSPPADMRAAPSAETELQKSRSALQGAGAPAQPAADAAASAANAKAAAESPARSRGAESAAKAPAPAESAAGAPAPAAAAAAPGALGAPSAKTRTDATPPPSFASLSQWTEMRIANINGDVRVLSRAEGGELNLLLTSAAIMAVGPQPLKALPEWRVALERKGGVLAVLELARNQVRWTEGGGPPATGVPPPGSLDALRAALAEAVKAPAKAPAAQVRRQQRRDPAEAAPAEAPPEPAAPANKE